MLGVLKVLSNSRKSIIAASLHFKGLGANFMEPHYPNRKSKNLEPEDYGKQFNPLSPKSLLTKTNEKSGNFRNTELVINISGNNKNQIRDTLNIDKLKSRSKHTRKRFADKKNIMSKVPSLPSIIQAYRADSMNIVRDIKKKLSKAAFNSAVKLSQALDEIYF